MKRKTIQIGFAFVSLFGASCMGIQFHSQRSHRSTTRHVHTHLINKTGRMIINWCLKGHNTQHSVIWVNIF